jgi:hypothetical protein
MQVTYNVKKLSEMGDWLDKNMPNLPLPNPQRWTLISNPLDGHIIDFPSEQDATWFALIWSGE